VKKLGWALGLIMLMFLTACSTEKVEVNSNRSYETAKPVGSTTSTSKVYPGDMIYSAGNYYSDKIYFGGFVDGGAGGRIIIYQGSSYGEFVPLYFNIIEGGTIELPIGNNLQAKVAKADIENNMLLFEFKTQ
jgi:hypothetical protein